MIFINEWLPNPSGKDASGEWIELLNSSDKTISLDGWFLTSGGKKFYLNNKTIVPGGYLVLRRSETNLVLANTEGALALYDSEGGVVDGAKFVGTAPEGKSFSRSLQDFGGQVRQDQEPALKNQIFSWTEPTPGAKNLTAEITVANNDYPAGRLINQSVGPGGVIGLAFGSGIILAGLVMIILLRNDNLSKLFFGGDETF